MFRYTVLRVSCHHVLVEDAPPAYHALNDNDADNTVPAPSSPPPQQTVVYVAPAQVIIQMPANDGPSDAIPAAADGSKPVTVSIARWEQDIGAGSSDCLLRRVCTVMMMMNYL